MKNINSSLLRPMFYLAALCLVASVLLSGCSSVSGREDTPYQTVTDSMGTTMEIPVHPKRVILLNPSSADLYCAAGGAPTIVGKPTSSSMPPDADKALQNIPEVGIVHQPNTETILSLQPDLVITTNAPIQNGLPDILKQSHIPLYVNQIDSYKDILRTLHFFGGLTGHMDTAHAAMAHLQTEREDALKHAQGRTGPRTLILVSAGQDTQAATASSFTGSLVKTLGGHNIADEKNQAASGLIKLAQEFIAQADPEVIFIITFGRDHSKNEEFAASLRTDPTWQTVSAVQNGRVYPLPHELFSINPGMRTGEALKILSHALYPDTPG